MTFFTLKPCKSSAAFEMVLEKKVNIGLKKASETLISCGFEIVLNANVILIVKRDIEVSIYPSGKLIVKTDSKEDAENLATEIYGMI
ncbi:MAG: hypothetical protein SVM80_01315 [Halobacteriota archaeon]|nr:hypothetical protein [Halobacteriota archaeon]